MATFKHLLQIFKILQTLSDWYFCKIGADIFLHARNEPIISMKVFCYEPKKMQTMVPPTAPIKFTLLTYWGYLYLYS